MGKLWSVLWGDIEKTKKQSNSEPWFVIIDATNILHCVYTQNSLKTKQNKTKRLHYYKNDTQCHTPVSLQVVCSQVGTSRSLWKWQLSNVIATAKGTGWDLYWLGSNYDETVSVLCYIAPLYENVERRSREK